MNNVKQHLLVVEDDPSLQMMMSSMLELEGYAVTVLDKGLSALDLLKRFKPAAVLLDIGLPDIDGVEVCRRLRNFSNVPVIMVTGNGDIDYKIKGLHSGADDYITKPFSYMELVARIDAVLRRTTNTLSNDIPKIIQCQDLRIDLENRLVFINAEKIDLSNIEYRILLHLATKLDTVVPPGDLLTDIWGDEYQKSVHLLQVNISRLRLKLNENPLKFKYIGTIPGQGYILHSKG